MASRSFHLIPESSTAIATSGRPVVTCQAVSTGRVPPESGGHDGNAYVAWESATLAPRTPHSSDCWWLTGKLLSSGVAASLNVLPSPPRSLGTSPAAVLEPGAAPP